MAESYFGTLRRERVNGQPFLTHRSAILAIVAYLESAKSDLWRAGRRAAILLGQAFDGRGDLAAPVLGASMARYRMLRWLDELPLLLVRLSLGWVFAASGWGKLHHMDGVVDYFTQLGVPLPTMSAPATGTLELVTGTMLCVGLAVRGAAACLVPTMAVAAVLAHRDELNDLGSFLSLTEITYLAALTVLMRYGGGHLGLDAAWRRTWTAVVAGGRPAPVVAAAPAVATGAPTTSLAAAPREAAVAPARLLFVFNADAGTWAALVDSAKKSLGRGECALCEITHSVAGERAGWQACRAGLSVPVVYVHRDEMDAPLAAATAAGGGLPCVLLDRGGDLTMLLDATALAALRDIPDALPPALAAAAAAHGVALSI